VYFHKYPHPSNFRFEAQPKVQVRELAPGITSLEPATDPWEGTAVAGLEISSRGLFGTCGPASLFAFARRSTDRFYGLGEKWTGFEHSDKSFKFWNTDVWADFSPAEYKHLSPPPDPVYANIPYLILKRGNVFTGLLLDTHEPATISTRNHGVAGGHMDVAERESEFWLATQVGGARLLIFEGPSLAELTRRFQSYVGTTPLPPTWALGYQQCRWGYESESDLRRLDQKFDEHKIPCDALWLDIGHMEGFRVFTYAKANFGEPSEVMQELSAKGRRVVPIIDPGVKLDPEFGVYQRGVEREAFCKNPEGLDYVGMVWPGESVFPDFSLPEVREWWAEETAAFAQSGIGGAWIDMNDPATGSVDLDQMLFNHGKEPHHTYHNAYALGMAEATKEGFRRALTGERTFLLSRSACLGLQEHAAVWTGDNYSNYAHLRACVATTLNLALSGIPFNGPDVGGFGGNTTPELLRAWTKACFLFPFMRNHAEITARDQEPWAFDELTLEVVRRFIRLRYRLRPYLYNLFWEQHRSGEAILRPLFYDFESDGQFDLTDDAFMVGPSILHAPFLEEGQSTRSVELPGGTAWLDVFADEWITGGRTLHVDAAEDCTPLYVRDQSILPLARIAPGSHAFHGEAVDFHVFLQGDTEATCRYVFDDGLSATTENVSEVELRARRQGSQIDLQTTWLQQGYSESAKFQIVVPSDIERVTVDGEALAEVPSAEALVAVEPILPQWKTFA